MSLMYFRYDSRVNKNLVLIRTCVFVYFFKNKIGPRKGVLLKVSTKLPNNPLASCSLKNLDYLRLQTAEFCYSKELFFRFF